MTNKNPNKIPEISSEVIEYPSTVELLAAFTTFANTDYVSVMLFAQDKATRQRYAIIMVDETGKPSVYHKASVFDTEARFLARYKEERNQPLFYPEEMVEMLTAVVKVNRFLTKKHAA